MSLYNMEELSKYHIATVKDIIWNSILDKRKSITIQTFNALKKEYRYIIKNTQKPKNKLIKLYEKLKGYNESIKSEKDSKKEKKTIKELNNKIKGIVSKRGNYDIKALGDIFKKSKMYDLDYPIPFIMKRIIKKLEDEFDSNNKKYNLNTKSKFMINKVIFGIRQLDIFIVIQCLFQVKILSKDILKIHKQIL